MWAGRSTSCTRWRRDQHRLTTLASDAKVRAPCPEFAGPHRRRLRINLDTATALGPTIPQSVLGRADQIIE
jgi:hypothetical protein